MEIREETKSRLKKIGSVGASYDAVINECIDKLEKTESIVNKCDGNELSCYELYDNLSAVFQLGDK